MGAKVYLCSFDPDSTDQDDPSNTQLLELDEFSPLGTAQLDFGASPETHDCEIVNLGPDPIWWTVRGEEIADVTPQMMRGRTRILLPGERYAQPGKYENSHFYFAHENPRASTLFRHQPISIEGDFRVYVTWSGTDYEWNVIFPQVHAVNATISSSFFALAPDAEEPDVWDIAELPAVTDFAEGTQAWAELTVSDGEFTKTFKSEVYVLPALPEGGPEQGGDE